MLKKVLVGQGNLQLNNAGQKNKKIPNRKVMLCDSMDLKGVPTEGGEFPGGNWACDACHHREKRNKFLLERPCYRTKIWK